ncbi:MAG TPA: hypothetical protein PLS38_06435 [Solirubrobacterales bacterium]|nr:hypothetical protein [Solirubrobacterales bacterium]
MGSGRKFSAVVSTIAASFFMLVMAGPASADLSQIPTATVTGPIAVTADSHPFLATDIDLDKYG